MNSKLILYYTISNYNNFSCKQKRLKLCLVYPLYVCYDTKVNFLERERERERTSKRALIKDSLDIILAYCSFLAVARKPVKELGLVAEKVQPSAIFSLLG